MTDEFAETLRFSVYFYVKSRSFWHNFVIFILAKYLFLHISNFIEIFNETKEKLAKNSVII